MVVRIPRQMAYETVRQTKDRMTFRATPRIVPGTTPGAGVSVLRLTPKTPIYKHLDQNPRSAACRLIRLQTSAGARKNQGQASAHPALYAAY